MSGSKTRQHGNIYPNPSSDVINVELLQNITEANDIIIQSIDGRIINVPYKTDKNLLHLDFRNYQSGIYLLNVTINQKRVVRKLIVG